LLSLKWRVQETEITGSVDEGEKHKIPVRSFPIKNPRCEAGIQPKSNKRTI
jgi:hypothetical protein